MSDMNLDIIQNKLDALVEKVIQNESSNEDFRITYAQILEKINTKIDILSGTENMDKLAFMSMEIRDAISKRQEVVDGSFSAIKGEFDRLNDILIESFHTKDIVAAYERIETTLQKQYEADKAKSDEILKLIENLDEKENNIADTLKTNFALIKEQNTIASENYTKQIDSLKKCNDLLQEANEKSLKNFETVLYTLQEFSDSINTDFSEIKTAISDKTNETIEKIHETDSYIELLNTNLSTLIQVVGSIFEDETFVDLQSDVTDVLAKCTVISDILNTVAKKDDVVEIQNLLSDINQSIAENISELDSMISTAQSCIIEEITDVISTEGLAISGQIDKMSASINDVLNSSIENAKENKNSILAELGTLSDNADKNNDSILSEISALSDNADKNNDSILAEISALSDKTNERTDEVIDEIVAVAGKSLESRNVIIEKISSVSDLAEQSEKAILDEIKVLSNNQDESRTTIIDEITDIVSEESLALSNQINELSDSVNGLRQNAEDNKSSINQEIISSAEKVNSRIQTLSDDLTNIISTESVAASEQIQGIADSVSEFKASLTEIRESLNDKTDSNETISAIAGLKQDFTDVVLSTQNEQINKSLNELQSKFVAQLVQVADNISFEGELYEITDCIQDCTDEIKDKISNDIAGIKQEISLIRDVSGSSDENIINLLEKIDAAVKDNANNDIKALAAGFKILTSGLKEDKDYVYTLPDIESDLSKIRLDLNKIQNSLNQTESENIENGEDVISQINAIKDSLKTIQDSSVGGDIAEIKDLFTTVNEDISSISKRTNKLILSSDEVTKTLNNNIDGFTSIIHSFERQSQDFYKAPLFVELYKKVANLEQTGNSISQSSNILNEAFMYLAEWIDSASETFEDITGDINSIKCKVQAIDVETPVNEVADTVKTLNARVEAQESKIAALDSKLDSINEKLDFILAKQNDDKNNDKYEETKSLLEFIASQVSAANEKIVENEKAMLKINNLDKQLKKIEKNIAIITEYIDEDSDDDFDSED